MPTPDPADGPATRAPAYRLVTPRLVLRCWDPADAPRLLEAVTGSVEALRRWMAWAVPEPRPLEEQAKKLRGFRAAFDRDEDYPYGIFAPDGRTVLGGTGMHLRVGLGAAEIGYWLDTAHHGRGIATEAAGAMVRAGFEVHGFGRMEIRCEPGNAASFSVARKLGFVHEGTLRQQYPMPDRRRDTMVWAMLADEYPTSPAARVPVEAFDALGRAIPLGSA